MDGVSDPMSRPALPSAVDVPAGFIVKDSGERKIFASGMVRDTTDGKIEFWRAFVGPMLARFCDHVTKGAVKYPDVALGIPNWTRAQGPEELQRARDSAARHFYQWMRGDTDEDHAAAVWFNLDVAEYVKGRMASPPD